MEFGIGMDIHIGCIQYSIDDDPYDIMVRRGIYLTMMNTIRRKTWNDIKTGVIITVRTIIKQAYG
jgi:hypothetical protein